MSESDSQIGKILKQILYHRNLKIKFLADKTGVSRLTIQRILAGHSVNPHLRSLLPIAKYFDITLEQLKGIEPIEWLCSSLQINALGLRQIPLFSPLNAIDWANLHGEEKKAMRLSTFKKIFTETKVSEQAFALVLEDNAMAPIFPENSITIIDPAQPYQDRCYVLAQLQHSPIPLLRQLIVCTEHLFIRAINPEWGNTPMQKMQKGDTVVGTLVEARQQFIDC